MSKIGYCTSFQLGDKVKPVGQKDFEPIMTVCAIQIRQSQTGVQEEFQVDWFDGTFNTGWVEAHQIFQDNKNKS